MKVKERGRETRKGRSAKERRAGVRWAPIQFRIAEMFPSEYPRIVSSSPSSPQQPAKASPAVHQGVASSSPRSHQQFAIEPPAISSCMEYNGKRCRWRQDVFSLRDRARAKPLQHAGQLHMSTLWKPSGFCGKCLVNVRQSQAFPW